MRDDGPDTDGEVSHRKLIIRAATTVPVPRLHREPSLLCTVFMQRHICKHAAARVESLGCLVKTSFTYPLIVSKKSFSVALKFPEISASDV